MKRRLRALRIVYSVRKAFIGTTTSSGGLVIHYPWAIAQGKVFRLLRE